MYSLRDVLKEYVEKKDTISTTYNGKYSLRNISNFVKALDDERSKTGAVCTGHSKVTVAEYRNMSLRNLDKLSDKLPPLFCQSNTTCVNDVYCNCNSYGKGCSCFSEEYCECDYHSCDCESDQGCNGNTICPCNTDYGCGWQIDCSCNQHGCGMNQYVACEVYEGYYTCNCNTDGYEDPNEDCKCNFVGGCESQTHCSCNTDGCSVEGDCTCFSYNGCGADQYCGCVQDYGCSCEGDYCNCNADGACACYGNEVEYVGSVCESKSSATCAPHFKY